ncbi:RelA/SpoT family protein [Acholeplasma laidlawii]|uniref:Penta-phosphate guanosine-3'-pyrophosphohydrolase n=2 Tax=Acholeplasma laidlawii TaxID=2148 RepID=A0A553IHT4_ACHLA|nr:bifunctional (p)ppGpp synthetase/guanosine-3',5'-bis(diphosphate) 3'-pyrophosphohydrolase [Acholeplasma laidlawii]NWH11373.1 bifunctional (p)ppGpp synthetase/guanosine-3',5'-bis(diphosphate) 3'-pyrophosphohydrolase [Acholeplasma laidlawii]NWH13217.1 bifunctional (p)ppGpp synthetase/guanosine-3',5'-bis(diphosphate) 3'-pyrophosphohydrolase [Acholeplasma laidlawii]NWH15150.1 bifunctional (p)ppGpp synthetase/guanosine-3',5'-bis(diphosphate) 3'-pyrophosphohydrolase [Acholeplasma laidlawii]OED2781
MMNDALYKALIKDISHYIKSESNINLITKAYIVAKEKHLGQMRKSGEPYITHPTAVARILAELEAGPQTLVAALLHDTVEDTDYTLEGIEKDFGKDVASLVDAVTKLSKLQFKNSLQTDNQQKMLLAMAKDIRVILIKIADRLQNMRTLDSMAPDRQIAISKETLDIYAPIAHRLGLFRWKAELEDRALRYVHPAMYYKVSNLVKAKKVERESNINNVIDYIKELFKESDLTNFEIKGRIKNIYSIYKKMTKDMRDFEDIYDLLAVRIIVDKVETCYQSLGIIHAHFTPIPKRFKDYIAVPKPNLYQSLHTTVLHSDGTLFEVQIRTKEMDKVAEDGIAAHLAYKENKVYSKEKEQFEMMSRLKWYADLLRMTEDKDDQGENSEEFVETVKTDIFSANVYVFTPKGEVVEIPSGGTPIDFAYKIHTDVGHKMVGATVNNRIVTLDYELQTGDVVAIKTNKNSSGPSEDWLKIAKSAHARHKIKGFINKSNYEYTLANGKELLDKELLMNKKEDVITDEWVRQNFEKISITNLQDLYLEIGKGNVSTKTVLNKLMPEISKEQLIQRQIERTQRQLTATSDTGVIIEGLTTPQIKLANCCTPIPGDSISGYVTKGSGIVVHAQHCINLQQYDKNRLIPAYWGTNINRKYATWIKIKGTTRNGLLTEIIQTANSSGIAIAEVSAITSHELESIIKLKVTLKEKRELDLLILNIQKVPQVYYVEREII